MADIFYKDLPEKKTASNPQDTVLILDSEENDIVKQQKVEFFKGPQGDTQDISGKQDKLIAGENITIEDNIISASGREGNIISDEVDKIVVLTYDEYGAIESKENTALYFTKKDGDTQGSIFLGEIAIIDNISGSLNETKSKAKEIINALEYLTEDEKNGFNSRVDDATTVDEINTIVEEAKAKNAEKTPGLEFEYKGGENINIKFSTFKPIGAVKIDWGDGSPIETRSNSGGLTHDFLPKTDGNYTVKIDGAVGDFRFDTEEKFKNNTREGVLKFLKWKGRTTTDLSSLLKECKNLTYVAPLDTKGVTNMEYMFRGCSALKTITLGDTSSVTNMESMFSRCSSLTTVTFGDTSSVTNMIYMFNECSSLTDVTLGDTSSVINMGYMFNECSALTTITLGDTSHVMDMNFMFNKCSALKTIILGDTSSVEDMGGMFWECSALTDVTLGDTSSVKSMNSMFNRCSSFQTLQNLKVPLVTNMVGMLELTGLSPQAYSDWLNNCANQPHQKNVPLGAKNLKYNSSGLASRTKLIEEDGWGIVDAGQV